MAKIRHKIVAETLIKSVVILILSQIPNYYVNGNVVLEPYPDNLKDGSLSHPPPALTNLNKYLLELGGGCLIHISNFQNGDIEPLAVPSMIQRMKPAIREHLKRKYIVSVPAELKLPIEITGSRCPMSYLLSGCSSKCSSVCGEFNSLALVPGKPWTCEATIALFPPKELLIQKRMDPRGFLDIRSYSRLFNTNSMNRYLPSDFTKVTPSYQPINILVLDEQYTEKGNHLEAILLTWMNTFLNNDYQQTRRNEIARNSFFLLLAKYSKIQGIYKVSQISSDSRDKLGITPTSQLAISTRSGGSFEMEGLRKLTVFADGEEKANNMGAFCTFIHGGGFKNLGKAAGFWKNKNKLMEAFSFEWASTVFNNLTMKSRTEICNPKTRKTAQLLTFSSDILESGTISLKVQENVGKGYSSVKVADDAQSLGIICCGRSNRREALSFVPFFNIFDIRIWGCIFVAFIIVTTLVAFLAEKGTRIIRRISLKRNKYIRPFFGHLWLSIIVLLKQGAPRLMSKIRFTALKCIYASPLLIGIVIVNAYLHPGNLGNLIGPRRIFPYYWYQQLISENFEIFSRVHIDQRNFGEGVKVQQPSEHDSIWGGTMTIRSEISYQAKVNSESRYDGGYYLEMVHRASKLHTGIFKNITKGKEMMNGKALREMENIILVEELVRCQRVAVVAPLQVLEGYYNQVRRQSFVPLSFIRPILHEKVIGFHLSGWVSNDILWRMKGMDSAGIWNRLKDKFGFSQENFFRRRDGSVITRANMSGNIITVFILLAFGIVVGIFLFIIEKIIQLCRYCCCRKKKSKKQQDDNVEEYPNTEKEATATTSPIGNSTSGTENAESDEGANVLSVEAASTGLENYGPALPGAPSVEGPSESRPESPPDQQQIPGITPKMLNIQDVDEILAREFVTL